MSTKAAKSKFDASNIKKKIESNSSPKKNIETKKEPKIDNKTEICKAARYLNTKQSAIDAINKGFKVYIINEDLNGKTKIKPYTECTRPAYENCDFCWKHSTTPNTLNLKNDIMSNSECKLADLEIFQPSNKKKIVKTELITKLQSNNSSEKPTLRIKITEELIKEIEHILQINKMICNDVKKTQEFTNLKDKIKSTKEEFEKNCKAKNEDEDEVEDESEDEDEVEDESEDESEDDEEAEDEKEDDADEEEEADEEELDVSEIHTTDGTLLYLSQDNTVYEPNGDGGEIIGKLMRVATKEAPYHDNNKYFIVGIDLNYSGKKYYVCKITNMVFSESKGNNSILKKVGTFDLENNKIIFS
jgi:hypothetical protein